MYIYLKSCFTYIEREILIYIYIYLSTYIHIVFISHEGSQCIHRPKNIYIYLHVQTCCSICLRQDWWTSAHLRAEGFTSPITNTFEGQGA